MFLPSFIQASVESLGKVYPELEARSIILRLCEERLGVKSYTHIIEPGFEISELALEGLNSDMRRLLRGEPLQYVLGYEEFCGRRFRVSPAVLIPRPETELLVDQALSLLRPGMRVLDLCTGSGCIAWSMSLGCPGVEAVGVDISEEALAVARGQFRRSTAGEGVDVSDIYEIPAGCVPPEFLKADVLDASVASGFGEFDLIVANPPYILESERIVMRLNVLDHEPELALFVPDEDPLLFYRAIACWASSCLKRGGNCIVEINEALGWQTAQLFETDFCSEAHLRQDAASSSCKDAPSARQVRILRDLSSRDRFVLASMS